MDYQEQNDNVTTEERFAEQTHEDEDDDNYDDEDDEYEDEDMGNDEEDPDEK